MHANGHPTEKQLDYKLYLTELIEYSGGVYMIPDQVSFP